MAFVRWLFYGWCLFVAFCALLVGFITTYVIFGFNQYFCLFVIIGFLSVFFFRVLIVRVSDRHSDDFPND